jgi:hypothetical protein
LAELERGEEGEEVSEGEVDVGVGLEKGEERGAFDGNGGGEGGGGGSEGVEGGFGGGVRGVGGEEAEGLVRWGLEWEKIAVLRTTDLLGDRLREFDVAAQDLGNGYWCVQRQG